MRACQVPFFSRKTPKARPVPMQSPTKKTPTTVVETHLHLGGDLGLGVRDLDTQLLGARNDVDTLPRGNVVGDPVTPVSPHFSSLLRILVAPDGLPLRW